MNPSDWFKETDNLGEAVKKFTVDDDSTFLEHQFPEGCPDIKLNSLKRVDYVLQEHPLEEANEYISGLTGHTSYFDLPDVGRFIISHIVMSDAREGSLSGDRK